VIAILAALLPELTVAGWVLVWLAGRDVRRRWVYLRAEARRQAARWRAMEGPWERALAEHRAARLARGAAS
jgi:hypothetical protein